ncbi:MAG: SWIM zinc finger domain-containing protein [Pseudogulbenkiania sp.]|nr:SWIM zinc finger domain-containing protein [Pseudogulbenkiania sp.]
MKTIENNFKKLTFDDLREWAGETILERGRGYIHYVSSLSSTMDGELAAWVSGSERYATSVRLGANGGLTSFCTCPYDWGGPCRHAIAVVLAAAEQVKQGKAIPLLDKASKLALVLTGDEEDDDGAEYDEDDEAWLDEPAAPRRRQKPPSSKELQQILQGWSKEQLVTWLVEQAGHDARLAQQVLDAGQLDSGQVDKLVRSLHKDIRYLTAEPAWHNGWNGDGHLPDYSRLPGQLKALLDKGHYDVLLQLGEELWQGGNAQVAQSDDEGESAVAIAECLEVVLEALPHSSLPPAEQLIWLIDHLLEDDYSLLEAGEKLLKHPDYNQEDWQMAARSLQSLLHGEGTPSASQRYRRECIVRRLRDAYARSGWHDKIIPLLEQEADVCWNYEQLVDALLAAGEREKARQWCIRGYMKTAEAARGIAGRLRDKLRELALTEGRHDLAAAYWAEEFFTHASRSSYSALQQAAEQTGDWPAVRAAIHAFLETGLRPDMAGDAQEAPLWPLPATELVHLQNEQPKLTFRKFPELDLLIDIAILEQRFDDVVELYRRLPKTPSWGWHSEKSVAEAVAGSHPQIALDIWRALVDALIAKVQPSAYVEAGGYLRQMHKVYEANGRGEEWLALLAHLRKTHKAKRRLQEVLDGLSGAKLV